MRGGIEVRVVGRSVVHLSTTPPVAAKILPGPVLVLVGSAAGLLEGDEVSVDIDLAPGAQLTVVTTAATLAHPCPGGGQTALRVDCRLGSGAVLAWLPEPLIGCAGCRHTSRSHLALAPGATAVWLETCTLGRSGEEPGWLVQRIDVEIDGVALLREGLWVGGPGWASPAVLDLARHVASLHLLGRRLVPEPPGTMSLSGPGTTARLVADRGDDLQRRLASIRPAFLNALHRRAVPLDEAVQV